MMWTKKQAGRYLLLYQGLLGEHLFEGKTGACQYVVRSGCIQFDPVDVCGKNAELTLFSRVKGMKKKYLQELLYKDRLLMDYPDKCQSIVPIGDWPFFARYRQAALEAEKQFDGLVQYMNAAREYMLKHGPVCSDDLPVQGKIHWHSVIHWSGNWHGETNAARSALEQMYCRGECVIHHKKGTRKYYDLAEKYLSPALLTKCDPCPDEESHLTERVYRRICAVGLLWNRNSDAFLIIWNLTPEKRTRAFDRLIAEGRIVPVQVQGVRGELYIPAFAAPFAHRVDESHLPRCEVIAPLDPMMWDRKLIKALFDFEYSWEIYTPQEKRKYGYYVLPLLFGDALIGRVEASADERTGVLTVKNIWLEENVKYTRAIEKKVQSCMKRLAKYNGCSEVNDENGTK